MDTSIWINFERIMVFIRADISKFENIKIITILEEFFEGKLNQQEMLRQIVNIMPQWKNQLLLESKGFCKENEVENSFVLQSLRYVKNSFSKEQLEVAYDLVDMLHAFPGVVLNDEAEGKEAFKKVYLEPVVKRWGLSIYY